MLSLRIEACQVIGLYFHFALDLRYFFRGVLRYVFEAAFYFVRFYRGVDS